jgi:tetratricopeptide (TPR) repeat protein
LTKRIVGPAHLVYTVLLFASQAVTMDASMRWLLLLCCSLAVAKAPDATEGDVRSLLAANQYDRAERLLLDSLKQRPDWETGRLLLGQLYYQTGRLADARREALAASGIRQSYDANILLAKIAFDLRLLNESIEWLNKAKSNKPAEPEIYKLLGLVYALGGVKKQSAAAFHQAVRLAPSNWEYHYFEGRALYDLEQFPEARRELAVALRLNPSSVRPWTALGQVQERTQDPAGAEESYRKAVSLCGGHSRECAWPLLELGRAVEGRTGVDNSEAYFRQALAARPDWAKPHYYLGKFLVAQEHVQEARKEFEAAVSLDGTKPEYFYQLAQVCRELGDQANAKRYFARFQQIQAEQKNRPPMELEQP